MFGQDYQQDSGSAAVPPMDPSVMADPSSLGQIASDDGSTSGMPPYLNDDQPTDQFADQPVVDASQPADNSQSASVLPTDQSDEGLLAVKQDALNSLSPLVSQLDQAPEEKFRTTMMMIQASDDRSLVKTAYEAAQSIEDPKTRAQALLDVINEINYFTSHTS